MLRIVQSKSAQAVKDYFADSLCRPDYYGRGGDSPGVWFGQGAKRLGLEGEVSQEGFFALADNQDPATGQRLTVRDVANRRPGYDFVLSAPKSVSAMWARTGDERLLEAFQGAGMDTMRLDVEPEMRTRLRRNGQDTDTVTGNLVGSMFLHPSTRPLSDGMPDPFIHLHAYVFNSTFADHENRWQAGQFGFLKENARYFEAAFEGRLARRLTELGYRIERNDKGWEIAGVPQSVSDKYSRRTAEIEAEAKKRGITDPARKAELGAKTRRSKEEGMSTDALREYWDGKLTPAEAAAMDAVQATASGEGDAKRAVTPGQAMRHAVGHVFARDSAVADKALLEEALRFGVGALTPEDVKPELEGHGIIQARIGGRQVVTQKDVLEEEQAMVRFAKEGRGQCQTLGGGVAHRCKRDLNDEKKAALQTLLSSRDRVMMLVGKAGTGKTTMLEELRDALAERGQELLVFAPTARASRGVLRAKGFGDADTVASLVKSKELQAQVRNNVIMVDEAGLGGTLALRQVFDLAEKENARVLVVGDPQQHRGVPRGRVLNILQEQGGVQPVRLADIRRQTDPAYRDAVAALSEGRAAEGFDRLDAMGFVREIDDAEERNRQLARDYADTLAGGQSTLIVSPTHAEGKAVSEAVRAELRSRKMIGAEDCKLVRYESKGLTEAQKKDAVHYQAGVMVQMTQNLPGFKRGERVTVLGRDDLGHVSVKNAGGEVKALRLDHAERLELYRTTSLDVAERDVLRVTRNGYSKDKHRLDNGDLVTVSGFTAGGDIIDQRGWVIDKDYGHLAHGVVTSHASQGQDADVVFAAQSGASYGASDAAQAYVTASRGKKAMRWYTDDKEALRHAIAREDKAASAIEVWQAREAEREAAEDAGEYLRQRQRRRKYRGRIAAGRDQAAEKAREAAAAMREQQRSAHETRKELVL
jgi:conjugative relaxase-like TrwC/TraI family protein